MLEQSIGWLRDESIKLAAQIDSLKENNKVQRANLQAAQEEIKNVNENAQTLQWHNIILKNTIQKLKSANQIAKYERKGYEKALKEFKLGKETAKKGGIGANLLFDKGIFDVTDQEVIEKIKFLQ